jgi:N6-adenosine-specific RNA methylase IME4
VATLPPGEKTRERYARIAGVSARTIHNVDVVKKEAPELLEQVRGGEMKFRLAVRRAQQARRRREAGEAPPLPEGEFAVILADPPWQSKNPDSDWAPENHYPTLALDEIAALGEEVPAAASSACFLWAVSALLAEALEVLAAWGFTYRTNLAWVKPSIGLGTWTRCRHELLLYGTRGTIGPPEPKCRPDSVIEAERGRHSEKPESVYELIERAYPDLPKLELFARGTPRPGWTAWGNEVES